MKRNLKHLRLNFRKMGFLRVVTLEGAQATLARYWHPKPHVVRASLEHAHGKVLAEDVASKLDVPPFDRSAVDGYAVRARNTFGADEGSPVRLKLIGSIMAGEWSNSKLGERQCAEIATGAPMLKGADAVVMVEHAISRGEEVGVYRAAAPGENVTKRGSEVKRGDIVAKAGTRLSPALVGTLAAVGVGKVKFYSPPCVSIISTGNELLRLGARSARGKVFDVNGPAIAGAVRECGGLPFYLGIVPDDPVRIRAAVERGLSAGDLVVISGGSSAGAGDVVPRVVGDMGKPGVIVHGLATKPGKPTFLAVLRGKAIFGLPGYPVSALVMFDKLVAQHVRRLAGLSPLKRQRVLAELGSKVLSAKGRQELVPVRLVRGRGKLVAQPIGKGSGAITSLSQADGYFEVPLQVELVERGEVVEVILLGETT